MRRFLTLLGIATCVAGLLIGVYAVHTAESMYAMFTLAFFALGVAIFEHSA